MGSTKKTATVLIAAGHGGKDPGAERGTKKERDETIQIVNAVIEILKKKQTLKIVRVPDSLDLAGELRWRKNFGQNFDLAIEIHKNIGGGSGTESFYYAGQQGAARACERINAMIAKDTGITNRGAKEDTKAHVGRLGWCRGPRARISIVTEPGFMDSAADNKITAATFARGIADGIIVALGV